MGTRRADDPAAGELEAVTDAVLTSSRALVALASEWSDSTLLVMAANIAGFGILWVAKFLFLDQIMFGHSQKDEVLSQEAPAV